MAGLLRGLGADVSLAGVVGDDADRHLLCRLLREAGIKRKLVFCDSERPTTVKERLIGRAAARHPHQMLRVDRESRNRLPASLEIRLTDAIIAELASCQVLLISDYNKGVCTPQLLTAVFSAARDRGIPVIVDPARIPDYARYRTATILKPNRGEAELASGLTIRSPRDAMAVGRRLCEKHLVKAVVVTLDSEGMVVVPADGAGELVNTRPREVYDVTGAGDMTLAMLGLCQATGVTLSDAVHLANVAAGLEIERLGVVPIGLAEIEADLSASKHAKKRKRVSLVEMITLAESYRRMGRTIVLTNGCFDLLHVGHVNYLQEAAGFGDILVVAVNSDHSIQSIKASDRPIIGQDDRATLLSALECVDHVLVFDTGTPDELLLHIRPDVLVKGGTYTVEDVVGGEMVRGYGGRVCVTGKTEGASTTAIIARVRSGGQGLSGGKADEDLSFPFE